MASRLRFEDKDTLLHRLNPAMKLSALVLLVVGIIVYPSWRLSALVLVLILTCFNLSHTPLNVTRGRTRFILTFSVLMLLVQVIVTANGSTLFYLMPKLGSFGPFLPVTDFGLEKGLAITVRFLLIVFSSMLFVSVTDPTLLAYSLARAGIPYRYAFSLVIALRFLPLFDSENNTVRMAQQSRGISLEVGSIHKILRSVRFTFFPLLVSALSRVESLSLSMAGRGFGYNDRRTYMRTTHWSAGDWAVLCLSIGFAALCFALGFGFLPQISEFL